MTTKNVFKTSITCGFVLTILVVLSATTVAQTVNSKTEKQILHLTSEQDAAAQPDEDDKLDESVRKFGSAAGAAYQCTAEADRGKLVMEVRQAYTRIGQLFGTDRAFYFAVHFGNSSQAQFDKATCPELLKKLRESILMRRAAK
jgi:hypothetical protein